MTKAFVRWSPCVAEEENDVQALPGGVIMVNWHTCPCPSAEREVRQQSQHLASRDEAGLHPVAGSCLTMLPAPVN